MKKSFLNTTLVVLAACLALAAGPAFGAGDTIFTAGVTKVTELLTGTGGILIALIAIVVAVVAGASGNLKSAITALGVAILASVGPSVANSFFTAVL